MKRHNKPSSTGVHDDHQNETAHRDSSESLQEAAKDFNGAVRVANVHTAPVPEEEPEEEPISPEEYISSMGFPSIMLFFTAWWQPRYLERIIVVIVGIILLGMLIGIMPMVFGSSIR